MPRASNPAGQEPATHVGAGPGHEHEPGATRSTSVDPPFRVPACQRAPSLSQYGFRPGRSQHSALDALAAGIETRRVNWVLDADLRDFFTSLDQSWLVKFLDHRIADRRVLRLIQKWLRAGVIEDGEWSLTEAGTAQGAGSGASRRCRAYARWSARPCPPNRTCPFLSIRLSTGHAMVDRDAGFMQRRFPVERWLVLCRWPSTARRSGGRDSGIG